MNTLNATLPTVIDLEHQWRYLGFADGAPPHIPAVLIAADVRSYRRLACPSCGHRGHTVKPMHRGRVYRLLCRCRKCGAGMEA
jgi:hypothetical protein